MSLWEESLRKAKANVFNKLSSSTTIINVSSASSGHNDDDDDDMDNAAGDDEEQYEGDENEYDDKHDDATSKRKRLNIRTDAAGNSAQSATDQDGIVKAKKAKQKLNHKPQSMFASCSYDTNGKPLKSISSVTSSLSSSVILPKNKHASYQAYKNRKNKSKK